MTEKKPSVEATIKNIRQRSRKKYSAEEKIQIISPGENGKLRLCDCVMYCLIYPIFEGFFTSYNLLAYVCIIVMRAYTLQE